MPEPKLRIFRYSTGHTYICEEILKGDELTNAVGVVEKPGRMWTGLSASPTSLLTGYTINRIDLTPDGIDIYVSKVEVDDPCPSSRPRKVKKHTPANCPELHVKNCPGCGRSCACYPKKTHKRKK
jgi:hypothetical protein